MLVAVALRDHRAAQRLLKGRGEFVFRLNWDVSPAVLLGETLAFADALLSGGDMKSRKQ